MRDYISQKVNETLSDFNFRGVNVVFDDELPENVDIKSVLKFIEKNIPRYCYSDLRQIRVGHREEFKDREISAIYRDDTLFITNKQKNMTDLLDDMIHEIAHHVEEKFPEHIYGDGLIKREFLKKRKQLEFELRSEGYWTTDYNFDEIKFSREFDEFLYNRIGKEMLNMVTTGIFIRPYGAVSIREYFATGFESYYLNTEKRDSLFNISPDLYDKIDSLDKKFKH